MKPSTYLLLLFLVPSLWADTDWRGVLDSPAHKTVRLSESKVAGLLSIAAQRSWNVFDLLNEAGLYLKARDRRVVIGGDELRTAAGSFSLGGKRVEFLLPLALVESVAVGARLGADADIEIRLSKPFSAFLELGDFDLQTVYGFRELGEQELGSAFGVTVRNGLFRWTLKKVARVPDPTGGASKHFIAIHLDNFFRAKRWKISPISALEPPTKP